MSKSGKGGGPNYEGEARTRPAPDELVLDVRKERIAQVVSERTRSVVVVLDRLEDSFNMAAVLRTCEAMGIQEVHVIENPEVPFHPHAKVTQGCDKWLDIQKYRGFEGCLRALKSRGFSVWVSALGESARSVFSMGFDRPMALVFGNERYGVSPDLIAAADGLFWIPMRGFTRSLNISAAVSATLSRAIGWRQERWGKVGDLSPEQADEMRAKFTALSVKQRKRIYGRV